MNVMQKDRDRVSFPLQIRQKETTGKHFFPESSLKKSTAAFVQCKLSVMSDLVRTSCKNQLETYACRAAVTAVQYAYTFRNLASKFLRQSGTQPSPA